ncbi:alpha,alpha-trehalose-phosphate synthase (UDP-forming) [Halococcoides cellulosivorans]|uniref:Trehalose-6-phosphate synthase n=1 Tax=Halococcoides cellulosivorans TaxID=1679096 RepID=A0A2R4X3G2_9EURY|nr:trehalose-6-phosphate synthase [Halococcoides cellulosivorans]AWB28331.1 trehalose-6-phosphate synthase [Halococcoides cellulosivorans]
MTHTGEAVEVDRRDDATVAIDDLVLVSNRQPYRHEYDDGKVTVDTPVGGLASAIDPVMQRTDGTWIAWGDGDADFDVVDGDDQVQVPPSDPAYTLERIGLTDYEVRGYYEGYANQALWPLCHTATGRVSFETDHWEQYRDVNAQFADVVSGHVDSDTTVWFQDYHFVLAPRMVRAAAPDAFQMQFFHIPWPAPDVFRLCPQSEAILDGLLGNDLLVFHTPRYCANFLQCVDQHCDGATVDWDTDSVVSEGRTTQLAAIPLGVDAPTIRDTVAADDSVAWAQFRARHDVGEETVAIGVDRLDYTKGIPRRLDALERLFETRPDLRGEFTYIQKGAPSREGIPAYQRLRETVEDRIRALNDRFGTDEWSPVVYTTRTLDRDVLYSLYRHSDMAIVSPLRDGMNLVAKEYVAAQVDSDGVLLLSPFTGAYEQLGEAAVAFDPYDTDRAAEAIERAIEMDDAERWRRMRRLRRAVHETDLAWWLDEAAATADDVRESRTHHNVRPN